MQTHAYFLLGPAHAGKPNIRINTYQDLATQTESAETLSVWADLGRLVGLHWVEVWLIRGQDMDEVLAREDAKDLLKGDSYLDRSLFVSDEDYNGAASRLVGFLNEFYLGVVHLNPSLPKAVPLYPHQVAAVGSLANRETNSVFWPARYGKTLVANDLAPELLVEKRHAEIRDQAELIADSALLSMFDRLPNSAITQLGTTWYYRTHPSAPMRRASDLRDAIMSASTKDQRIQASKAK